MFKKIEDILFFIADLFESAIPEARLGNDSRGRTWFLKAIDYSKTLVLKDLREVVDTKDLNKEYRTRYKNEDTQSRKGISAIKAEISMLYSFKKCFVQRYKGRLHFYRDDLSQKGARNMATAGQAHGLFELFKKNLD
jgi:hypothetical protein